MLLPRGKVLRFKGRTAEREADAAERELADRCERVSPNEVRITVPVPLTFGPARPFEILRREEATA